MEKLKTEVEFIEMLHEFFEIIQSNTNIISREDCFCCKYGKQFSKEQMEQIKILGLKPDKENGGKQHYFLGEPGKIVKEAEFCLRNKLGINEWLNEDLESISRKEKKLIFTVNVRRKIFI